VFPYVRLGLPVFMLATLVGCGPDYSANTYSTAAVQQANKVEQGVIAGYREVAIRADGTVGAVTGGAAGGVLGAQAAPGGVTTALSAIGGTLIGGLVGTTVEHAAGDTKAFEYLVRKPNGDLVSVTQKDMTPLAVGLKVLVIEGKQARIVADYSVPQDMGAPSAAGATGKTENKADNKTATKDGDASAKSATTDGADKAGADKAANRVTTTDAPSDTGPAPTQASRPAPIETSPAPASGVVDSAPAPQPAPPQASPPQEAAPQAAATSASDTTPSAPALRQAAPPAAPQPAAPQPAQSDQDGSAPPAASAQEPASNEGSR
jgi:outer membrane lipoprotein SlyB